MNNTKPQQARELVINATLVTQAQEAVFYEFILGADLCVSACGYLESLSKGRVKPIHEPIKALYGSLFELNHVRVDPSMDNTFILHTLMGALEVAGVHIKNKRSSDFMSICFKPLGELSDIVRFYIAQDAGLVFLSKGVTLQRVK
ncbi:MAG TPA: hypothetical protein VI522_04445 [Gammaproteobacteria bacterium]|nr:hypothetical protein [Gammaproteobacteria bacterium]